MFKRAVSSVALASLILAAGCSNPVSMSSPQEDSPTAISFSGSGVVTGAALGAAGSCVAKFYGNNYLFYIDKATGRIAYSYNTTTDNMKYSAPIILPVTATLTPTTVLFNGRLFVFYVRSNALCYISTGDAQTWTTESRAVLPGATPVSSDPITTDRPITAASSKDWPSYSGFTYLHIFYRAPSKTQLTAIYCKLPLTGNPSNWYQTLSLKRIGTLPAAMNTDARPAAVFDRKNIKIVLFSKKAAALDQVNYAVMDNPENPIPTMVTKFFTCNAYVPNKTVNTETQALSVAGGLDAYFELNQKIVVAWRGTTWRGGSIDPQSHLPPGIWEKYGLVYFQVGTMATGSTDIQWQPIANVPSYRTTYPIGVSESFTNDKFIFGLNYTSKLLFALMTKI